MAATRFEFERRFWLIGLIFGLGFSASALDSVSVAAVLVNAVRPGVRLDSPTGQTGLRLVFGAGALLTFGAAWLRTWSTAYLRSGVVHAVGQHSDALVTDGPFRYVRHPLYLANLLLAAGVGVLGSRLGWFVMVAGMWTFVRRLMAREEEGLRRSHGDAYEAYAARVPRLWPSATPRVPGRGRQPYWREGVAAEMFVWLLSVAVLCLAGTLNYRLAGAILTLGFAVYFVVVPIVTRASHRG